MPLWWISHETVTGQCQGRPMDIGLVRGSPHDPQPRFGLPLRHRRPLLRSGAAWPALGPGSQLSHRHRDARGGRGPCLGRRDAWPLSCPAAALGCDRPAERGAWRALAGPCRDRIAAIRSGAGRETLRSRAITPRRGALACPAGHAGAGGAQWRRAGAWRRARRDGGDPRGAGPGLSRGAGGLSGRRGLGQPALPGQSGSDLAHRCQTPAR